jgi:hypothetical protein
MNNCDFIAGPECLGTISTKNGDNVRVIEIHVMVQLSEYFGAYPHFKAAACHAPRS